MPWRTHTLSLETNASPFWRALQLEATSPFIPRGRARSLGSRGPSPLPFECLLIHGLNFGLYAGCPSGNPWPGRLAIMANSKGAEVGLPTRPFNLIDDERAALIA